MDSSEKNADGSPKSSKWYGKLFGKSKVSSSDSEPKQAGPEVPKERSVSKSPPLVVNYFPSGQGLLRL